VGEVTTVRHDATAVQPFCGHNLAPPLSYVAAVSVTFQLSRHAPSSSHIVRLGSMNRRRFGLQKGGSQEHISLITMMFCFNEFAFIV